MNSKIKTLLVIAASAALTGCSFTPSAGSDNSNPIVDTGVVTEDSAPEVQGLYADALENTEDLEEIEESESEPEESSEESSEEIPEESSEEPSEEPIESEPEEGEEASEEESSEGEEEEPIEDVISSYHVDYTYEFGFKASVEGVAILDFSETESYSLTYVNDENGLFLDMSLTHEYKENAYSFGSETVHAIYQDEVLYVTSDITAGEYDFGESKISYEIGGHKLYGEFGDFFRYTYNDFLLDSTGKQSSYDLLAELIASENVEVTSAEGDMVTLTITEEGTTTTLSFDTSLSLFTGATIDSSEALLAGLEELRNNDVITIDEAISKTTIAFSYNDSTANRLSEDEIAEYSAYYMNYGHHNDHEGYGEEGGHHDGRGHDHDDWGDYEDDWGDHHDDSEGESEYDPWGDWNDWDEGSDDSEDKDDPWGDYWGDDWGDEGEEESSSSAHGRH